MVFKGRTACLLCMTMDMKHNVNSYCTVLMWLGFIVNAYIIMLELTFRLSGLKKTDKAHCVPLGMPCDRSWRSVEGSMFSMPLAMRRDPLCLRQHILTGHKIRLGWPWPLCLSSKRVFFTETSTTPSASSHLLPDNRALHVIFTSVTKHFKPTSLVLLLWTLLQGCFIAHPCFCSR